jgi:hypothetical protein
MSLEPVAVWVGRVSPILLLRVAALNVTITVTDLALAAYERALEPKQLQLIPGGHFDAYVTSFPEASGAARAWFRKHLTHSLRPIAQSGRGGVSV